MKPFTSLLIYEDQDAVNAIPTQGDMLGSYVDLELFYQYIWQEFEKYPEYRSDTAFIFAAEGMDELLMIAPSDFPLKRSDRPQSLAAVHASMRSWMNRKIDNHERLSAVNRRRFLAAAATIPALRGGANDRKLLLPSDEADELGFRLMWYNPVPALDPKTYTLKVRGLVDKPLAARGASQNAT